MRAGLYLTLFLVACSGSKGDDTGAGGSSSPGATSKLGLAPLHPSILLSSSVQQLDAGITSTSFNFTHLSVLWVRVALPTMGPTAVIHLKLMSPRGNLMFEADLPFSTSPGMMMAMPDVDHPVAAHPAKPVSGGYYLDYPIAVVGSPLTRYPEPGAWQLMAQLSTTGQTLIAPIDVNFAQ